MRGELDKQVDLRERQSKKKRGGKGRKVMGMRWVGPREKTQPDLVAQLLQESQKSEAFEDAGTLENSETSDNFERTPKVEKLEETEDTVAVSKESQNSQNSDTSAVNDAWNEREDSGEELPVCAVQGQQCAVQGQQCLRPF